MNITTSNIEFSYPNKQKVIDNISTRFQSNEISVILGESGCGKSTLLRCIANLEILDSGTITFDGKPFNHWGYKGLSLSFIFQDYALYQGLSVEKNITIAIKRHNYKSLLEKISSSLNIKHLFPKQINQLSGGEKQRVAIARSLILKPKILLMDEPFSNLDYNIKSHIKETFIELQKELNITTLIVTHNQSEASEIGNKIYLMNNGKIAQEGTFEELYNNPKNKFVATFLGNHKINKIQVHKNNIILIRPEHIYFQQPHNNIISIKANFIRGFSDSSQFVHIFNLDGKKIRVISKKQMAFDASSEINLYIDSTKIISL